MNFYPFHLGDYAAHTRHLSLMEDLAYRRMIDLYYTSEQVLPPDVEKIARLIGMREHSDSISNVLSDFFLISEAGYRNVRCDREIAAYRAKAERAKSANKARWNADSSENLLISDVKSDVITDTDRVPTNTNNQEPISITSVRTLKTAARFPEFWLAWPATDRKTGKAKCEEKWKKMGLDAVADKILSHVAALKQTKKWAEGFEPAPMTFINGKHWLDDAAPARNHFAGMK